MPADALLYDQNVLDWVLAGELTGDREYIGRGFVHSARGLTDWEKQFIQWTFEPAKERSPLNGMSSGVYDQEYTLRYLSYGAQDSSKADEATAKARAEAAAKGGNEHPKKYSCSACDAHPGRRRRLEDGGKVSAATSRPSPIIERMIKAPPWLFSAESDVYKNPKMAKRSPGYRGGDRVVGRYWGATPRPPRWCTLCARGGLARTGARLGCACCVAGMSRISRGCATARPLSRRRRQRRCRLRDCRSPSEACSARRQMRRRPRLQQQEEEVRVQQQQEEVRVAAVQ